MKDPRFACIKGNVSYLQRMAVLPGSILTVELRDITLVDAPSITLACHTMRIDQSIPLPYCLTFDHSLVREGHTYQINAYLAHEGRITFHTTEAHLVELSDFPVADKDILLH